MYQFKGCLCNWALITNHLIFYTYIFIFLQRNDIAMAITKYDQFDFLIDIVPRDDIKPNKIREDGTRTTANPDQVNNDFN